MPTVEPSRAAQRPFAAHHIQVVAPHSDDAALSCGATLALAVRLGARVDIITCFSVSNFVFGAAHDDAVQACERRIGEDQRFVEMLGDDARLLPLAFLDAPLRTRRSPSTVCSGDELDRRDLQTVEELRAALEVVLRADALILAPAALGSHIDHRIALAAVRRVEGLKPCNLWCYEDLPYTAEIDAALRSRHFEGHGHGRWSHRLVVNPAGHADKRRLLSAYPSQAGTGNITRILEYGASLDEDGTFAERFWRRHDERPATASPTDGTERPGHEVSTVATASTRSPAPPPIPASHDELDAQWLTRAFRFEGLLDDGVVSAVRPAPAAGGNPGTSRVLRLFLEFTGPHEQAPDSVVAKIRNPDWRSDSSLYEHEVRYYNELAAAPPRVAPRCYYSDTRPAEGAFVLILEDLTGCQPGHRLTGILMDEAGDSLEQLAAFHAAWWENADLARRGWPVKTWSPQLAREKSRLYRDARQKLLEDRSFAWPRGYGWLEDGLEAVLERDILRMASIPRTLIHGDLSNQNFLLDDERGIIIIDWQRAALGPFVVDVAHLLFSLEPARDLRTHIGDLCQRYCRGLVESGVRGRPEAVIRRDIDSAMRYYFSKWAIARARSTKAFDRREPLSLRI